LTRGQNRITVKEKKTERITKMIIIQEDLGEEKNRIEVRKKKEK
jgi:hypothetical protein